MAFLHTTGDFLVEAEFDGLYQFLINGGSWLGIHSGLCWSSNCLLLAAVPGSPSPLTEIEIPSRGLLECHAALVYHSCWVSGKDSVWW